MKAAGAYSTSSLDSRASKSAHGRKSGFAAPRANSGAVLFATTALSTGALRGLALAGA